MKHSYFCKTLQDQIKCQKMLFAKGCYWNVGQEIQYTNKSEPVIYHYNDDNYHLTYSIGYLTIEEAEKGYPKCKCFGVNTFLMETE